MTVIEGNAGTTTALFTVTLSAASTQTVTVDFATSDGTGTAGGSASAGGADYVTTSGSLTFLPGQSLTQTVSVTVTSDTLNELTETFVVDLSNPANATLFIGSGRGTITNDDALPALSIADATVTEGNTGTANAVFTVSLSAGSGFAVTVDFASADGTATLAGSDYQAASGSLTFAAGEVTKTVTVLVNGDTLDEANETFAVSLSNPTNATIATALAAGAITDDDPSAALSIDDITQTEGSAGTKTYTFTVTLNPASGQQVTVNHATANNSASAGTDYVAASGPLTFAPCETTKPVVVTVNGDVNPEPDESFFVNLSGATNATVSKAQGIGVLLNDDSGGPSLSIANVSGAEGNTGTSVMTFTVTLSAASSQTVTVNFATRNGSANAGGVAGAGGRDYDATTGQLSFPPGTLTRTIPVTINGDLLAEGNELFFVDLSNAVSAAIATPNANGTITNDDTAPSLSINDVAIKEGTAGQAVASFTVSLSAASGQFVTFQYSTANGTAQAGAGFGANDYGAIGGTFASFAPGVTTQSINVVINGDTLNEGDDTFFVNLANVFNATVIDAQGLGTITNDDASPSLSINDLALAETNGGTTTATFTITLSAVSALPVTFTAATANGTATAGSDYVASSGMPTITPGNLTVTRAVTINGDLTFEPNETVFLDLSAPTNATIAKARGIGTINNDDLATTPALTINDVAIDEGNSGTVNLTFTVTLTRPGVSPAISVDYATADFTATTAGFDYVAKTGTLNFAAGAGSPVIQTFTVTVNGDVLNEANEQLAVNLSNATGGATIVDPQGLGGIRNDDPLPGLSINNVTVAEGNGSSIGTIATFTVALSAPSGRAVAVNYSTANGSATAVPGFGGSDYLSASGTLTFAPGETSKTIAVTILGDTLSEANETFTVNLSGATNALIVVSPGVGTITNDDAPPTISIADVTQNEGNAGPNNALFFPLTLSAASGQTVTVNFATADGTALAGSDYSSRSGTATFTAGQTTQNVFVQINGDTVAEATETFVMDLTLPTNATLADPQGQATLVNDD